ncbi:MAG TPA: patatin-like phospholipase family protein [Longimicrobiales bacterium]|nr:patatin-like phospholipase family protein [Longimicrobiales bacterium]
MKRIVLVLGGGGVKGVAHVGAWRAIQEAGVEVAEIVGTSIGSLIGASIAAGTSVSELEDQARELEKSDIVDINRWALLPNGIRQRAVFRGAALSEYIERVLPVREWSELSTPLGVNAVDLESGEMLWFGAGGRTDVPLVDAIRASTALPVFYPPVEWNGMHLVDGGVMDSLPVTRAAVRGADLVIAIHASSGKEKDARDTVEKGLVAIQHRVLDITAWARRSVIEASWNGPPVLWIRPNVQRYSTFDFDAVDYFLEEGYRATRDALRVL